MAKHYGDGETRIDALRRVDLQVRAGEVIALLGPSGSGKTALLNIIGCILDRPQAGWCWTVIRSLTANGFAVICVACGWTRSASSQAHNLLPFLTAAENVSLVLDLAGWPPKRAANAQWSCWIIWRSATAPLSNPLFYPGERSSISMWLSAAGTTIGAFVSATISTGRKRGASNTDDANVGSGA
ncbi:MAG: ATP-binding cassette domain-containing protein [Paracoccaceae bacterium]